MDMNIGLNEDDSSSIILKDTPKLDRKSISKFGMSFYKHNFPDPNRVKENIKQRQCFNSINQRYLSTSKSGKTHTARIDLSNKENISHQSNSTNESIIINNIPSSKIKQEESSKFQIPKRNYNSRPNSKLKSIDKHFASSDIMKKMCSHSELGYYTSQKDTKIKKQRVDAHISGYKDFSRKQSIQTNISKRETTPDSISSKTTNSKFDKLQNVISRNKCLINWKLNRPHSLRDKCSLTNCENSSKVSESNFSENISQPIRQMKFKKHNFKENQDLKKTIQVSHKDISENEQQNSKNEIRYQPLSCKSMKNSSTVSSNKNHDYETLKRNGDKHKSEKYNEKQNNNFGSKINKEDSIKSKLSEPLHKDVLKNKQTNIKNAEFERMKVELKFEKKNKPESMNRLADKLLHSQRILISSKKSPFK